ncbi:MAG: chromate transporter [Actinomycetaceae bacterium]|nr:chromate transporter [Actinomycetaceae bacterium]
MGADDRTKTAVPARHKGSLKLLLGYMYVGLIGFGGGSALIPVIEKEIVEKLRILSQRQYDRHVIVANITPGALPAKLASFAGFVYRGTLLSILAALAVSIPGVAGTVGLMALSEFLGPKAVLYISYMSVGIAAFIIALLLGYILKIHVQAGRDLVAFIIITAVSALAVGLPAIAGFLRVFGLAVPKDLPHLSAVSLIGGAIVLIVIYSLVTGKRGAKEETGAQGAGAQGAGASGSASQAAPAGGSGAKSVKNSDAHRQRGFQASLVAMAGFVGFTGVGVLLFTIFGGLEGLKLASLLGVSSITSFGGGEAYVGVADGFFVQPGLIDRNQFYTQLVPIANALPGPILIKIAAGIGYIFGIEQGSAVAFILSAAALAVALGACCAVAMPVLGAYEKLKDHPIVKNIGRFILPVICGLLIGVSFTMLDVSAEVAHSAGVSPLLVVIVSIIAIVALTVIHVKKWAPDIIMIIVCGVVSLVGLSLG